MTNTELSNKWAEKLFMDLSVQLDSDDRRMVRDHFGYALDERVALESLGTKPDGREG